MNSIELLEFETKLYLGGMLPPISTLTWFKGNHSKAEVILRRRLIRMIQKNPWLRGKLTYTNECVDVGKTFLQYPKEISQEHEFNHDTEKYEEEHSEKEHLRQGEENEEEGDIELDVAQKNSLHKVLNDHIQIIHPSQSPISRKTDIDKLGAILKQRSKQIKMIGNNIKTDSIFKVIIIPCKDNPDTHFGVLIQLCHIVGDGFTYYQLVDMLFSNDNTDKEESNKIISLNIERDHKFKEKLANLVGVEEVEYFTSFGCLARVVRGVIVQKLSRKQTKYKFEFLDNAKIKKAKMDAAKEGNVAFVSTNDVITTWFMNQVHTSSGVMAIHCRNRLDGITDLHVGNYEHNLFYRREDFATPALLRQSLTGGKFCRPITDGQMLPSFNESAFTDEATVTNWFSLSPEMMEVEGCEEELHLPIFLDAYPPSLPFLCIFRASKGKIGLLHFQYGDMNYLEDCPFV